MSYLGTFITHPDIESYLSSLMPSEDPVLREMEEMSINIDLPIVGPLVGRLLNQLTTLSGAKRIFELGSGIGYSAYWFAMAAGEGGIVHVTDKSETNLSPPSPSLMCGSWRYTLLPYLLILVSYSSSFFAMNSLEMAGRTHSGTSLAEMRSAATDAMLTMALRELGYEELKGVSLIALGGYGREELCPHSDIDLLFLYDPKREGLTKDICEKLLYLLWDLNLKIGHSVRTRAGREACSSQITCSGSEECSPMTTPHQRWR